MVYRKNIVKFKNFMWMSANFQLQKRYWQTKLKKATAAVPNFLPALLSDNENAINYIANKDDFYKISELNQFNSSEFLSYQINLAIREEWDEILVRCDEIIKRPPRGRMARYMADHHFFRALATKNEAEMISALDDIVSPKSIQFRSNDEHGFSDGLFSTPTTIYTKLAWRAGHRLRIDSDYVFSSVRSYPSS